MDTPKVTGVLPDLLGRYLRLSEKACVVNQALSAVRPAVDLAYRGSPSAEDLFLFNDLQLFLIQVFLFDGYVTTCEHYLHLSKDGPITERLQRLTACTNERGVDYERLLSGVSEIARVRDVWVHALGDPSVLRKPDWPARRTDRFGLRDKDDSLWVHLSHKARDGRTVWSFVISTLQGMAKLLWPGVEFRIRQQCLEDPR